MPVSDTLVGKRYPPLVYAVGREKIREYAEAVLETHPLHHDLEAARAAGYRDLVAPPMFAVVYTAAALGPAMLDPDIGLDISRLVHAGQQYAWGRPVVAGDEISTEVVVKDISERKGLEFYVFESVSHNQAGEHVCTGTMTNIVRSA